MRLLKVIVAAAACIATTTAVAQVQYQGSFSQINVTGSDLCSEIFAQTDYGARHYLVGPSRRTLVTNFTSDAGGFFDGQTFASNFGYNNDFLYEKSVRRDEVTYEIEIYGFLDRGFVAMEAEVKAVQNDEIVCSASAEFFGTN